MSDYTPGNSSDIPSEAPAWTPSPAGATSSWQPASQILPPDAAATAGPTPPLAPPPPAGGSSPGPSGSSPRVLLALVLLVAAAGFGYVFGHNTLSRSETFSAGTGGSSNGGGALTNPGNGSTSPGSGNYPGFNFGGGGSDGGSSGTNTNPSPGSGSPSDVSSIAAKVTPALVDISSTFSYESEAGAATGIVIGANGIVLTNNHVVEGATAISATDLGNHHVYKATVVGYDWSRDVAVLKLTGASGLTVAKIASHAPAAGEGVVVVGNAGGLGGTPTAAGGSITAVNQSITASDDLSNSSERLTGLIQTNADIQPGDSGGSLVNSDGEVVGIDTAASLGYSFESSGGEGFAIPIARGKRIATAILTGKASATIHVGATAFLGVGTVETGGARERPYGFYGGTGSQTSPTTSGAQIANLVPNEPASEAGLVAGDVITGIGSARVSSPAGLVAALVPFHPGQKVVLKWADTSGASHSATVTLASGPAQ